MDTIQSEARNAISRYLSFAESAERKPGLFEPPFEQTLSVLQLEAAWALQRVGATDAAAELTDRGLAALSARSDAEQCAADLYRTRLTSGPVTMSDTIGKWATRIPRWDWYPLFRLQQHSFVLTAGAQFDAVDMYTRLHVATRGSAARSTHWPMSVRRPVEPSLEPESPVALMVTRRRYLLAHASHGLPDVVAAADQMLVDQWTSTTDQTMSSSQLWCVSLIGLFDAVVFAVAKAANPRSLSQA